MTHKYTMTRWLWTDKAELAAKGTNMRRPAGTPVMERSSSGQWVKREAVPVNWIEMGYVKEEEAEQLSIF
ncbi:hypothetical protein EBB07_00035 [Paenibacillaceae bacterium]|nr:hypothetical protein EBB07_00035 [Paenibacillaceae bacterium]